MSFALGDSLMDFDLYERMAITNSFIENQEHRAASVETFVQKSFATDPFNPTYQSHRSVTKLGLEIGSLAAGGYGLVKGGFKLIQSSRHLPRASSLLSKEGSKIASQIARKELKLSSLDGVSVKPNRKRFISDPNAIWDHTVFRRDPISGKVTHYEAFRLQTNPYDLKPWESIKRYDGNLLHPHEHYNKVTRQGVPTPHVHDPFTPGEIRIPELWEIP